MTSTETEPAIKYQCECIPKMREQLEKHHGQEVQFELAQFMETPDDDAEEVTYIMGFQPFFYRYTEKVGGRKKLRKRHVSFQFCPMCGKKL